MAGYLIANYRITNPDAYNAYIPAVMPTLRAHHAEVVVADYESDPVEGQPAAVTIVIRFPSRAAARAWYDSPEYQAIVGLRTDNSEGFVVFANEFVTPR
jgi:uncharacterized protein (DUF1330 family)